MTAWLLHLSEESSNIISHVKDELKFMQYQFNIRNHARNLKISCVCEKVIFHPIPYEKKVIASSELILRLLIWQTLTDFREDPKDYGEGLEVRIMLRPTSFPFLFLAQNGWKIQRRCLPFVTSKEKNRMKSTSAPCATHTQIIHFMNCMTAVQFRNWTSNHCNQVPICTHSINLLPVGRVYLVALRPPTDVRQRVRWHWNDKFYQH